MNQKLSIFVIQRYSENFCSVIWKQTKEKTYKRITSDRTNPVVAADKTTLYVAIAAVMSAIMAFTWIYKFPSLHYHISPPLPPLPSTSSTVHTKIRRWIAGWLVGWLRCLFDRPTVQTENRLEQNKNTENVKKATTATTAIQWRKQQQKLECTQPKCISTSTSNVADSY